MLMDDLIPEKILSAYDILLQYRVVENITEKIKFDATNRVDRWFFKCNIKVPSPNKKSIPELVELEVEILGEYPYSTINCYSKSEIVQGYPHQDAVSGKLCLKEKSNAPLDERRLAIYLSWAKEWLIEAANDELVKSSDPYELPDFNRKFYKDQLPSDRVFLFNEDENSFIDWGKYIGQFGKLKCRKPARMLAFFVSDFQNEKNIPIKTKNNFSNLLFDYKNDIWGYWVIVENIYFKEKRPPQNFGEIRELFSNNKINFDRILKKSWEERNKNCGYSFILIGFPIPEKFYGENKEIHWIPLIFNNLDTARKLASSKKTKRIWRDYFMNNFSDEKQLPWSTSYNINHSRLFSRSAFESTLQNMNISLFGCGAIGSIIAENLTRGGNTNLCLFDKDSVEMGNLCRHTLDGGNLTSSKSFALCTRLLTINPFANINAYISKIPLNSNQKKEKESLLQSSLFIDCTTDETAFHWLNDLAFANNKRLLSIFININAEVLTLILSGKKTSCLQIYDSMLELIRNNQTSIISKEYFSQPSEKELIIEGIGCWHATFPAMNIHINMLVSTALDILNNYVNKENGLSLILRRNHFDKYMINEPIIEVAFQKDDYE
jgi:molybdopterin/thiamine biosynthesis adenylyltransferase